MLVWSKEVITRSESAPRESVTWLSAESKVLGKGGYMAVAEALG